MYKYIIILLTLLLIISITFIFKEKKKILKEEKKFRDNLDNLVQSEVQKYTSLKQNEINDLLSDYKEKELNKIQKEVDLTQVAATAKISALNQQIEAQKALLESEKRHESEQLEAYKDRIKVEISSEINEHQLWEFQQMQTTVNSYIDQVKKWRTEEEKKLEEVKDELKDFQDKRRAVNEEIMRRRAIEEKEEFYRVVLDEKSLHDLALLNEIRSQLSKIDFLDKIIYDNYIAKPVNEMIKRVLNGGAPCGIYKITRLKTGEVYIGQSTNIKNRWQQHAKSCYNCGTISHSTLHTIMKKDGIENFTWELIEEVDKSKLTERERYWINFYDSKKFGLNEKV